MVSLYVARFTIDGIEHVFRGYGDTKPNITKNLQNIIDSRNANIPGEKAELGEVYFGAQVDEAFVKKIEDEVRAKNPNGTTADALHPDAGNRILHEPVNPAAEVRDNRPPSERDE